MGNFFFNSFYSFIIRIMSLHRHKSFIMDGYDQMMPTYHPKRHKHHHHSNASASTRASTLNNMNQYYHGGFRTKKIHPVVVQESSRPPQKNAFYRNGPMAVSLIDTGKKITMKQMTSWPLFIP